MPLIKLTVSTSVPEATKNRVLTAMSGMVVKATGKPPAYVMATMEDGRIVMGGKNDPAAFADVRGIGGLTPAVNKQISKDVCELLKKELGIKPENVYLAFTDVAASNWGWNGGTFG
jgi:phenylpyruvate tautomerase PptA (4-oxalocrotonate tautomerase family)